MTDWQEERRQLRITTVADELKKELFALSYRISNNRFASKKDAELELEKIVSRYNTDSNNSIICSTREEIDKMVDTICQYCNKPVAVTNTFYLKCWKCKYESKKKEHEKMCIEQREEVQRNPIIRYCHEIRGIALPCEMPFPSEEQQQKYEEEDMSFYERMKAVEDYDNLQSDYDPKCGISKSQWEKERKRKQRLLKEMRKQNESDRELQWEGSPCRRFRYEIIDRIGCECKAEQMRQGVFCKTCRLMRRVQEFTLDLFKNAAEGRGIV